MNKFLKSSSRILLVAVWLILTVMLLFTGTIAMLYSPSAQDNLREKIVARLNREEGMYVECGKFRLKFPLKLEIGDILIVEHGDTMLRAGNLDVDVEPMPLLIGKVDIPQARLVDGFYRMGDRDSSLYMKISATEMILRPASVDLKTMDIRLDDGIMRHALVDMTIKPDTTPSDTAKTPMKIMLKHLDIEDLTYVMRMMPTIDSLGTNIRRGQLNEGTIDLGQHTVQLRSITGDSLNLAYISPTAAEAAAFPVPPTRPDQPESEPWTITIDTLSFYNSKALYTTRGVLPQPGLDFGYISADPIDLEIIGFYNRASILRVPLKLKGRERCGIDLEAKGTFMLNDDNMVLRDFVLQAPTTLLRLDALMGLGDMTTDPSVPLRLKVNGYAGIPDILTMFPGYGYYLKLLPPRAKVDIAVDINGTPRRLDVKDFSIAIKGCARLQAQGSVDHVFSPDNIGGDIDLSGEIVNVKNIVNAFIDPSVGITVPPMTLKGKISYHPGVTKGDLTATTGAGKIALKAGYRSRNDAYDIDLTARDFPVNAFMPDLGVGRATLDLKAHGNGFDLFRQSTTMDIEGEIKSLEYDGYDYRNINLTALIEDGVAELNADVDNDDIQASLSLNGNLRGDVYDWDATIDGAFIDLYALKLTEDPAIVSVSMSGSASISSDFRSIDADLDISDLLYSYSDNDIEIYDVKAHLLSTDTLTSLNLHNRDLVATATIPLHYSDIADSFGKAVDIAMEQIKKRNINVDTLQRVLPKFNIDMACGSDNMITDILGTNDMGLKHMSLEARNDSSLYMCTRVFDFTTGSTRLDSIDIDLVQLHEKMHVVGTVNNRPGTLDNWAHITVDGMVNNDKVSLRLTQQDIKRETGYDIGAICSLADSVVNSRIFPLTPVIGYKKWTVNLDNFIKYNFYTQRIDANLKMKGDKSSIQLLTDHPTDTLSKGVANDILLKIGDIQLADWISFNPFAPPVRGSLSADMRVRWNGGTDINGSGTLSLSDLFYDNRRVADLDVDMNVKTNGSGTIRAGADIMVDGEKTMSLAGNLNDSISGSPFNLDFTLIKFPLSVVNPFLPVDMAQLTGTLNGNMLISGDSDNPIVNGEIYFDKAAIKAAITNTSYNLSGVKIPVKDNVVTFKDFSIKGANDHPLYVNGTVDIRSVSSPIIDLNLKADNMMIVNTNRAARNASVFGKGYIDLDADINGSLRLLNIDANLSLLSGSNLTYLLTFDTSDITSAANEDMVKFVNLNDTTAVAAADSIADSGMLMNIDVVLKLAGGTTINVELPTGTRDKVVIQPQGTLTYTQTPLSADGRLTGRINLNSGMARYTLPVIGAEKSFTLNQGSYVAFNGEMLNPVLNISATDAVKCNVAVDGQGSHPVNFDILVDITGTLERIDLKFDLTTKDDITIANELQSMSVEQRANQAMNMLLYNMYTGPGSSADQLLSANPLFSFLESQINNWAAQNIHGVDLSFGIDQYNTGAKGVGSPTMSYSYQVSKTLFNDRVKILVGGNYTTDNNADENLAENLINDISFEYYLNSQQTMIVKVFRHMGYESILEGEIIQTGVGFVYRRKMDTLWKVLPPFLRPHPKKEKK